MKTIVRHLKRTFDKGTQVKITGKLDLIDYVDANRAGLFGSEHPRNPNSPRSRCGCMIILGGVPLFGKSMLMTAICLSTLEAECQALSLSLKQVIGFKLLIEELVIILGLEQLRASISTTVCVRGQPTRCTMPCNGPTSHQPHEVVSCQVALLLEPHCHWSR
jgi:hypothetical protein